ncbi:MAG: NAD(P)/FAD-dependent oxidoreductase [Candidatus Nitrosotenuis sp.]
MKKLTIIGGGITGMAAAYIASRDGWDVTLLEGSSQLGGLIRTFRIGGKWLECFYHHHFIDDLEFKWFLKELKIDDKLRFYRTSMGIFCDGKIYDFNGPLDLMRFEPLNIFNKFRFIFTGIYLGKIADWRTWEGITATDWFYKYVGRKVTEKIWKPLLEVKFGSYSERVPLSWMIGRLKQRMNSRRGAEEQLGYLDGSLQLLTDTFLEVSMAKGVKVILNTEVNKLIIKDSTLYGVETTNGVIKDGLFLVTIPVNCLVPLLKEGASDYAKALSSIQYMGAVCTILELVRPLTNVYWLNIADSDFPFGGIIEHTNFIPPGKYDGSHIVYLSKYFTQNDYLSTASVNEVKSIMIEPLKRINPEFSQDWIKNVYVFKSNTAATACWTNFSKFVPHCKTPIKNLYIVNMSHIYPDERSCNNAIKIAARACRIIGIDTSMIPVGPSLSGQIGMD